MEEAQRPGWQWPEEVNQGPETPSPASAHDDKAMSGDEPRRPSPRPQPSSTSGTAAQDPPPAAPNAGGARQRRYGPRTCRICLDTVEPRWPEAGDTALGMLGLASSRPGRPVYASEPPEGRLISPCTCRGSQKYVHEGCLQAWRAQSPVHDRNYIQCPTCKFRYRTDRVTWAALINSWLLQLALTVLIMLAVMFVLGFVADPLINFWLDPLGSVGDAFVSGDDVLHAGEPLQPFVGPITGSTWTDHFLKGFAALGVAGVSQGVLRFGPWNAVRLRGRRRRGGRGGGRERLEDVGWGLAIVGAFSFMWGVWRFVRQYVGESLRSFSDRVLDVQDDDDDDEEETEPEAQPAQPAQDSATASGVDI